MLVHSGMTSSRVAGQYGGQGESSGLFTLMGYIPTDPDS